MQVLYACCCGLDVHKKTVVACLIRSSGADTTREFRTFGTTTRQLQDLAAWLQAQGCTIVAMESTGVYWRPVFNLLEHTCDVILVNPRHMRQVPGRKTDIADAEWIADLLRHGLLKASFIPPAAQRAVRELTRYRTTLLEDRAQVVNRIQKVLEDTNIKLGDVASNVMGASAQAMLRALLAGETDTAYLAEMAKGRLRKKRAELAEALVGVIKDHHRFLLTEYLDQAAYLDGAIARVDAEIARRLAPYEHALRLLETIPGVGRRTAEIIMAEVGMSLDRFPSARHLAAWAGMAPSNHESAGKRIKGGRRQGNRWLRHALTEAGHAAGKSKNTYLSAQHRRLTARRGGKRAAVAVGHSILVMAYHMLKRGEPYRNLGANYFDERARQAVERRLVQRLEKLGYTVIVQHPETVPAGGPSAEEVAAHRAAERALARKRLPLDWRPDLPGAAPPPSGAGD